MDVQSLKKYIYEKNKIEFILNDLGCNKIVYHTNHNYFSATQPDGDNEQGVNIKNNEYLNYRAYTKHISYEDKEDLISLVQTVHNETFSKTIRYLHKLLGLSLSYSTKVEEEEEEQPKITPVSIFQQYTSPTRTRCNVLDLNFMDEDLLDEYAHVISLNWFREGIIKRTIEKFELAYSFNRKRNIIPMRYWLSGELMGFNMRSSIENAEELGIRKYLITKNYMKEYNLYGLYENYNDIERLKYITVVEAEKSVLKRDSRNDPSCVALSGHFMSPEQVRIILGLDIREVVIAMDKDVPIQEVWDMCENFYMKRKVSFIIDLPKWNDGKGFLKAKDSPVDAHNKIYNFMFEHRITYDERFHKLYLKSLNK